MTPPVDLLVIGGSGFIGAKLVNAAVTRGRKTAYTYVSRLVQVPADSYQVNLEEQASLENCIYETKPHVVVYCAVPSVKANETLHHAVSIAGVRRTLVSMGRFTPQSLFIYVSTNAIFSGIRGPYYENDTPDPETRTDIYSTYAITRAEGEHIALTNWPNTIVVRTSTVNGYDMQGNLNQRLAQIVRSLRAGQRLLFFSDRWISPTLVDNLVEALLEISGPSFDYRGILHLAGCEQTTDYEYALLLTHRLRVPENLIERDSIANSLATVNLPSNNSLSVDFTQSMLHTRLLSASEQLSILFS